MMIAYIAALVLLGIAFAAVTLEKAYFYLPLVELKRRAHTDQAATALLPVAVYGAEVRVFLIGVILAAASSGLVLFARLAPPILGVLVVLIVLALGYMVQPCSHARAPEIRLAAWCAPALAWLLGWLHPVLQQLVRWVRVAYHPRQHTGIFESKDLEDVLVRQGKQKDNRLRPKELARLRSVLHLDDYIVRDALVPVSRVIAVHEDDEISPVFVNDLHHSGHVYFPVYSGDTREIVGILALGTVADVRQHGRVRDNIDTHVVYLHERDSFERAIYAFYVTRQHLFVVVDDRGTYKGIITLSDILQRLFGAPEHGVFNQYDDREAVARQHRATESSKKPTEVV
jgi:CBS domain containing-hemolysin-like protein